MPPASKRAADNQAAAAAKMPKAAPATAATTSPTPPPPTPSKAAPAAAPAASPSKPGSTIPKAFLSPRKSSKSTPLPNSNHMDLVVLRYATEGQLANEHFETGRPVFCFAMLQSGTRHAPYAQLTPALGRAPDYIGTLYGGGPDAPEAMWAFLCNFWSWRIAKERFPPLTIEVYAPPDLNIAHTTFKHETFTITVNATTHLTVLGCGILPAPSSRGHLQLDTSPTNDDSTTVAVTGNTWPLKQLLDDLQFDVAQVPDRWLRQQVFRTDDFSDTCKPLLDACKKIYVDLHLHPSLDTAN
ncbi:unnamed protein product, partial [Durusdinium trenchii]